MNITVVGAGYVGLVTAACFARRGHRVRVLEISSARVDMLRRGRVPFFEPNLEQLVNDAVANGTMTATAEPADSITDASIVLICVGTPLGEDGAADLSQVRAACESVAMAGPDIPVVVRSTLPLGTTRLVAEWLGRATYESIVTNPEFLRQGTAVSDFEAPSRIVIGTHDATMTPAAAALADLYAPFPAPLVVADYTSAEMVKNVANAFLATRLSFINEVADLCEAYDADVEEVVKGVGLDPRIGSAYFRPGIGFGGSCLPKELANLVRLGQRHGLAMPLLEGVARVNDARATRIVDRLEQVRGSLRGQKVCVLGIAFKPNTDDTRYSPAVSLANRLVERGATVVVHDPVVPGSATAGLEGLSRADHLDDAVEGCDLLILATEWPDYRDADWARLRRLAHGDVLFDGRNALDEKALRDAGWRVVRVGRRWAA